MRGIRDIPTVVAECVDAMREVFANEPQRQHLAEYLTGLMIAERKSVSGMQSNFVSTTDQSCWNRFLTESQWDETTLNERRLELLQEDPTTRYSDSGVIAVDDVLIDHDGKLIDDVGWFWDHAEERYKIAHDYLIANYVCPNKKHYPLEFRVFKKREYCEQKGERFRDHGVLFRELVDWVEAHNIPGTFTFDCYFSSAENLNYIHAKRDQRGQSRAYVGDLKFNRKIWYRGQEIRAIELAHSIAPADRKELRRGNKRQWYFTVTVRLPKVNHKVRIVIIWDQRRAKEPRKILITNRTHWEIKRIVKVYRHRWTGTETFHRDAKQELGMGDCQLRKGRGQTRHMYLVMLAYSVLMRELRQRRAKRWAFRRPQTIGEACRAVLDETLQKIVQWVVQIVIKNPEKVREIPMLLALT